MTRTPRNEHLQPNPKPIVLLSLVAVLFFLPCNRAGAKSGIPTADANKSAPNFSRMDINHRQVSLAAYRGKVILLDFWATWCAPCLTEIPHFVQWQQEYGGQGFQVIGVSMDDDARPVRLAFKKYGLNYPVVMGDEKIGELYGGVLGLPVSFVIDRKGRIRFQHQGVSDLGEIQKEIQTLLQEY